MRLTRNDERRMKETLRHMRKFLYITPYVSSTIFGNHMRDLNYMQNNRHRSDFTNAYTGLPLDAITPLK